MYSTHHRAKAGLTIHKYPPGLLRGHARAVAQGIKFPVICMSAHWDEATLAEASRYEPIECLRKPFSGEALLSAVEIALQCER